MENAEMIALLTQAQQALGGLSLQGSAQWQRGVICDSCIARVKRALQNATRKEEKTDEHGVQENQ